MFTKVEARRTKSRNCDAWLKGKVLYLRPYVAEKIGYPDRVDVYTDAEELAIKLVPNDKNGTFSLQCKSQGQSDLYMVASIKIIESLAGNRDIEGSLEFNVTEFDMEKQFVVCSSVRG